MTRTDFRSVRLGMDQAPSVAGGGGGAALGEQLHEAVEQVEGVVGAGRGLRVELHGEGGPVEQAQALDDLVVQGPVGDLDAAEARLRRLDRLAEGGRPRRSRGSGRWMATRPVALSSTGWFGPRWPNFSL
ncbi:hypothetical protein GY12_13010 [Micrococcus luteus]|nr:hypothetical protein GY12_13010 [Micrococcus luteus]